MKHEKFVPLSSPGGDGRNDIALLYIRTRAGRGISFDKFVTPACLPAPDNKIKRWVGVTGREVLIIMTVQMVELSL